MSQIEDCLRQVMAVHGALGVHLIDYPSGSSIGAAGPEPADGSAHMIRAAVEATAFTALGRPDRVEEIVVTADDGYHVVHVLSGSLGGRLALYVWLDRMLGNLALTQRTMRSVGAQLSAR